MKKKKVGFERRTIVDWLQVDELDGKTSLE